MVRERSLPFGMASRAGAHHFPHALHRLRVQPGSNEQPFKLPSPVPNVLGVLHASVLRGSYLRELRLSVQAGSRAVLRGRRAAQVNAAAHKLCCYRFAWPCGKCDCGLALHVRGAVGQLRTLPGSHAHNIGLPACYHPQRPVPALCGAFELALGVHHCHAYAARLRLRC